MKLTKPKFFFMVLWTALLTLEVATIPYWAKWEAEEVKKIFINRTTWSRWWMGVGEGRPFTVKQLGGLNLKPMPDCLCDQCI